MFYSKSLLRIIVLASMLAVSVLASAQSFPTKAVTLIVPFAPGGPTDAAARTLAPLMEQTWKQPFTIENRPGAGGIVGTQYVSRANPDGHTLLFNGNGVHTAKIFTKVLPYNPEDLKPVVELAGANYVIVSNTSVPAKTFKELLAYLKEKGSAVNAGSIPYTAYDLDYHVLQRKAQLQYTLVPYNSAADIVTALLRNDIQFYFAVPISVLGLIDEKKVNAIGITGPTRNSRWPQVPTIREEGLDFDAGFAFGIWAPARVPADVLAKIGADIEKAVLSPDFGARMKTLNFDVAKQPRAYPARIEREIKEYSEIAKQIGIDPR